MRSGCGLGMGGTEVQSEMGTSLQDPRRLRALLSG